MAQLTPKTGRFSTKTVNEAGGTAYVIPLKERFISRVMTSLWQEPSYYGNKDQELVAEADLLLEKDPQFVLKTAMYARDKMNLRTVPVLLLARYILNKDVNHQCVDRIVQYICTRPDQLQDLVGYLNSQNPTVAKSLHSLLRGIAKRLGSFDSYQYGKYISRKSAVRLADLIRMSHPKPKDEVQSALFKAVLDNRVEAPNTWETGYMQAKTDVEKAAVWVKLLNTEKLPYMAALRNLRNMCKVLSRTQLGLVGQFIANPERVAKSKQFPFRFYAAYKMLQESGETNAVILLPYVGRALDNSIRNLPDLDGYSYLSADNSGSMQQPISGKSKMQCYDIANLFQAMLVKRNVGVRSGSVFGERFREVSVNRDNDVLSLAEQYKNTNVGHSTNGHKVMEHLIRRKLYVDRVIILTDLQLYVDGDGGYGSCGPGFMAALTQYRKEVNSNVWIHWVNLSAQGTCPAPLHDKRINLVSGWSDAALHYFKVAEEGTGSMLADIENMWSDETFHKDWTVPTNA